MEAREWRMRLLDRRRDLREQESEEFETAQMLLKEVRSLLKEARVRVNEQRKAELEEEVSEAWRNRRFALLRALRVEYARNGRGPKKRYYFSPRTVWNRENWSRAMAKPASMGGMGCPEPDWEANYINYVRQCKEMANEELPDNLECCNCSGTGQSSDFEVREKSTKKKSLPSLGNSC